MQSKSTDLQRNNVLPEIYLIICEILNFLHSKGAFLRNCEKRLPEAKPNLPKRED